MRFGVALPTVDEFADVRSLADLAREAEASGWDGVFVWDVIGSPGASVVDTWIALTAIALATERIRFGPMVTPLPRRRAAKVARETATLDRLSGGRMTLAVGLGGLEDTEFEALGEESDPHVRAAKLDEALEAIVGLWSGAPFSYEGEHVRLHQATFLPTPVQQPRIPIWVGGVWPNRAPARRAARWDGMCPMHAGWPEAYLSPEDYAEIARYIVGCRTSEGPFDLVAFGALSGELPPFTAETMRAYVAAGVTWWVAQGDGIEKLRTTIRRGPISI